MKPILVNNLQSVLLKDLAENQLNKLRQDPQYWSEEIKALNDLKAQLT